MIKFNKFEEPEWVHGDDLCDCTFQRIGFWTNPYIAETKIVRFCCIWKDIERNYPQFVQEFPAFCDYNQQDKYINEPRQWDSEDSDMPRALWYRQIVKLTGKTLEEVRELFKNDEPPKAVKKE